MTSVTSIPPDGYIGLYLSFLRQIFFFFDVTADPHQGLTESECGEGSPTYRVRSVLADSSWQAASQWQHLLPLAPHFSLHSCWYINRRSACPIYHWPWQGAKSLVPSVGLHILKNVKARPWTGVGAGEGVESVESSSLGHSDCSSDCCKSSSSAGTDIFPPPLTG